MEQVQDASNVKVGRVIMLSGPIGSGKTTVAQKLLSKLSGRVSYIEGDTFWQFFAKADDQDRRERFRVMMRSMTAAAVPFARSGYDVLIDFSIPPHFIEVARKILKEVPLDFVLLNPGEAECASRAAKRPEGKIPDYSVYHDFYALFNGADQFTIENDRADAALVAAQIADGLEKGKFRVNS